MASAGAATILLGSLRITVEAQRSERIRTLQQQYGDGYLARRQDGINASIEEWQVVTRPLRADDAAALEAEIRLLGPGYFRWTPPGESTEKKWVLYPTQWTRKYMSTTWSSLSFTIRRWYG